MAIDLLIMPLSRLWSGDYITPAMRQAWDLGVPYRIVRPNQEIQEFASGTPYGGEDAPTKRKEYIVLARRYITQLPQGISKYAWDESSSVEPEFYRLDPKSFGSLLEEAQEKISKSQSLFQRVTGRSPCIPHLPSAEAFFPVPFQHVFELDRKRIGSLVMLKSELEKTVWSQRVEPSLGILREGVEKALHLRFPMFIDS
jgi:hypothetical protein